MRANGKERVRLVVFVNRSVLICVDVERAFGFVRSSGWSGNRYKSTLSQVRERGRNELKRESEGMEKKIESEYLDDVANDV
jgi:hypothetical protein